VWSTSVPCRDGAWVYMVTKLMDRIPRGNERHELKRRKGSRSKTIAPYLFVLPNIVVVVLFGIYPLVDNIVVSLTTGDNGWSDFVGGDNYLALVHDSAFLASVRNTFFYTLMLVPVTVIFSLGIAIGMNKVTRFRGVLRAAYVLPYLLSWSVSGLVWRQMFQPQNGIINWALASVGLPTSSWLLDPNMTMVSLAIVGIWAGLGYYMIIYLAGLQGIPSNLYEAAEIDGASSWQQFRHVTLPGLRPITSLVVILVTIASFRVFEGIYVMTGGGPGHASFVLVLYIFIKAFTEFSLGYAAAISCVLFAGVMIVTLILQRLLSTDD